MECHPINERLNRPSSYFFAAPGFFPRQRSTTAHERIRYHPRSPQPICSNHSSIGGDSNRLFDRRGFDSELTLSELMMGTGAVRIFLSDREQRNLSRSEMAPSELLIATGAVRMTHCYRMSERSVLSIRNRCFLKWPMRTCAVRVADLSYCHLIRRSERLYQNEPTS